MSWLSSELHNLEDDAASLLTGLEADGKALFTKIEPILKSDAAALLNDLLPIASSVIGQFATAGTITNATRNAALAQVEADAVAAGISAGSSVLNAALSIAELNAAALSTSGTGSSSGAAAATTATAVQPVAATSGN